MSTAPLMFIGRCDGGSTGQAVPATQDRAVRRPTRLAALPAAATVVLAALAVLTGDGWLLVLAGASTGLFLAGLILPPDVGGLVVCLLGPSRLAVGGVGTYEMHVHNRGTRTSSLARVTQRVRGFADLTVLVEPLSPGQSAVLSVERSALSRGTAERCEVVATSSAPLGLQRVSRTVSRPGTLVVHPLPVPAAPLPAGGQDGTARDTVPARTGLDPHGIRQWRPGDAAGALHGRSSARRDRPMVLERAAVRAGAVTVLLAAIADDDGWEQVLSLTAATACALVQAGRSVALVAAREGVPGVCTGGGTDLLDWCAALGRPRLPDAATLRLAVEHARDQGDHLSPQGTVCVAATAAVPALWWAWARELEGMRGVRLVPLLGPAR